MRMSAHVGRGLRIVASGALVAAGTVLLAAPADAAPARLERVGYTCKATNSVINTSLQGPQQFYVTADTDLPASVTPGSTVPATDTTLTLFLPPKLVNRLTGAMKVTDVKGSSTTNVDLQAVAPGGDVIKTVNAPVKGPDGEPGPLVKDWVKLVPDTEISIVARGKVDAIPVPEAPEGNGLIYVQMPKEFTLHSEMTPPVIDTIDKADLRCTRDKDTADARVIGTIKIGAGCSEADCPLPAASGGGGNPTPTDGPAGPGTDPEVIDPVIPDDPTDVSDSGYEWEDTDGDGVPDSPSSTATSAETTSLPDTGSPVATALAGLFAALVAVRLALAVRGRRTGA